MWIILIVFMPKEEYHKYLKVNSHHNLYIIQKPIDIRKIGINEKCEIKCWIILEDEQNEKSIYFIQLFFKAATIGKHNSPFFHNF